MEHNSFSDDGIRSVHLQVTEHAYSAASFESRVGSIEHQESNTETLSPRLSPEVPAPEKKLTLFAFRLAVLEKSATQLGTLGFIWATVVLLGGFAITLEKSDFWLITFILLFEGTRIFSRSRELEWQNQATWSPRESSPTAIWIRLKSIFRPISSGSTNDKQVKDGTNTSEKWRKWNGNLNVTRRWESSEVPILPYAMVFLARNTSKILQLLQIAAAIACVGLSLMKLIIRNYGDIQKGDSDKRNRKAALIIFYSLALAEASLFLLEKAYWQYEVTFSKILEKVNEESELGPNGMVSTRRFFYDAYSKCLDGSIFDGLEMDMVSFATELLGSNSPDEQLMGARILRSFALSEQFSDDTLQKIGTNFSTMERFVEMLSWKGLQEEEIRQSAAEILSKMAGKRQNSLRIAGIPGALESIASLLHSHQASRSLTEEVKTEQDYDFLRINELGLLILKKLARDHDNCGKIGNARDLLPKIINFTHVEERELKSDNTPTSQIQMVKRSLEVVKRVASTTGETGTQLRRQISEHVFTISNIRDILRHGEKYTELQKLGVDILTSLAMEDKATEKIEGTGGILKELLNIFFKDGIPKEQEYVRTAAGEALVMLALDSQKSCQSILKLGALEKLVKALEDTLLCVNAGGILRNLCAYSPDDCFEELRTVIQSIPIVLRGIISKDIQLQEAMVGLAAYAFRFMTLEESRIIFERAEVKEEKLARSLVDILREHRYPHAGFPRIRRFAIELEIWMMRNQNNIDIFRGLGLEIELENVLDTTSEIENFNILSGSVGLSRFTASMQSLVERAHDLLQ